MTASLSHRLASRVIEATGGLARLGRIEQEGETVRAAIEFPGESGLRTLVVEVRPAMTEARAYKTVGELAFSYQGNDLPVELATFDRVVIGLADVLAADGFDPRRHSIHEDAAPRRFPTPYHRWQLDREVPTDVTAVEAFRRDGHVMVRRLLPRDVVVAARPAMMAALASAPAHAVASDRRDDAYDRAFRQITDLGRGDAVVRAFAYGRRVLRTAADLMGVSSVQLFCEDWLVKDPGSDITPWHQDEAAFPFDAEQSITCWIPLQDVDSSNGLMRFARGSHALGLAPIEDISDASEQLFDEIISSNGLTIDDQPAVLAGDVSFHHGLMIHGAGRNRTDEPRVVLALHCFASGARIRDPRTSKMRRLLAAAAPKARVGGPAESDRWPVVFERGRPSFAGGEPVFGRRLHLRATLLPHGEEPTDVWVEDGRIRLDEVDDAPTVAPAGGFLTTGLVECHGHISYPHDRETPVRTEAWMNARRADYAATGVLLLRDMGAVSDDIASLTDVPGLPRVHASGNMILRHDDFPFTRTDPEVLVETCVRRIRAGARWVKIFADWSSDYRGRVNTGFRGDDELTYPLELLREAVDAVHRGGGRVAAHCFTRPGAEVSVSAGVDTLEHGWGVDRRLVSAMASREIAWAPLAGIAVHMWRTARREGQTDRMRWIEAAMASLAEHLPLAVDEGVVVLAGTDMFPEVSVADEVRQLHELGLGKEAALGAATWTARTFLGEPGIEEGAPADLVLYRTDPREDLDSLLSPELVLSGGERVVPSLTGIRPVYRSWAERNGNGSRDVPC